jgi:hypothetical protein
MFNLNNVRKIALCVAVAVLCAAPITARAFDMTLDGFGSMYYSQAYSNNVMPVGFSSKTMDFTDFSFVGLNVNSKLDDKFSVAAQFLAKGPTDVNHNSYSLFANFAYIQYVPMDSWEARAGRQATPVFSTSEHFFEHFGVPFRTTPQIVFDVNPFDAFDGVSLAKTVDVGPEKLQVGLFGGNALTNGANSNGTFEPGLTGKNLYGAKAYLNGDGWLVHGSASTVTASSLGFQAHEQVYSLGYRFDRFNFVSWGEYVYTRSGDGSSVGIGNFNQKGKAGYVLVGYHMGDWTPRYTFAQASVQNGFLSDSGKTTTHTIGVNYQASAKVIAKAEFEIDSVDGSQGAFEDKWNGTSSTSGTAGYVGVDFIF